MGCIILGTNNEVESNIMGVPWAMEHPKVVQVMVQGAAFFGEMDSLVGKQSPWEKS
jgi:aconitase A